MARDFRKGPAAALALAGALAALAALSAGGCGAAAPADSGPPVFPADALTVASSTSGSLSVELRTDPQPPVRGAIRGQLFIADATGAGVDGLDVSVLPWMPAHGHGTSVATSVTAQGGGLYLVDQLYLYMAGTWELRTTISGAMTDAAVPAVEVP
jgi:hypothetical protein